MISPSPTERQRPAADRRVQLMATCLCDAFNDDVARATVEVLESLGCTVEFPAGQTCCGQPAFNAGDWPAARGVIRHTVATFAGDAPVVVPSASCAAMVRHGSLLACEHEPERPAVAALGRRTWELADFIVHGLGVTSWPGRLAARVAFHQSCHSRGTASVAAARQLLGSIAGLEVIPLGEAEQCCGFGGTFSVAFPHLSSGMGHLKLEHVRAARPDFLVSSDQSCLLHLGGLAAHEGSPLPVRHLAQVLRDARRAGEGQA